MLLVIKLSHLALLEVPQIWLPRPFDMVFLGWQDVWDSSCIFLSFSLSWLFFHVQQEKKKKHKDTKHSVSEGDGYFKQCQAI